MTQSEIALIPKLGIKSWRDSGSPGVIYAGMQIRSMVELLLPISCRQQLMAAKAWLETGYPADASSFALQ